MTNKIVTITPREKTHRSKLVAIFNKTKPKTKLRHEAYNNLMSYEKVLIGRSHNG